MKYRLLPIALFTFTIFIACKGKNKEDIKDGTHKEVVSVIPADDGIVPKIDTANLKDGASILDAMQKVVDARIADEKKRKEDPNYKGHFVELMRLHTAVLKASMFYAGTLSGPDQALEFNQKVNDIEKKLDQK